ncbi:transposase, partial [Bradyrhizobium sp. i1.8.4]|uniref:hypothetical protein n=1 Tax=unclassified Bradyrhizobium TaxID=2631580 RepID=UPI003D196438
PHRDWLPELRRNENDLRLDAIAERLLGTHGVEADTSMLSRASSPPRRSASKKARTPANRIVPTSPSGGKRGGVRSRAPAAG